MERRPAAGDAEPPPATSQHGVPGRTASMDGWYDIAVHVHVPVGDGDELLTLGVMGKFRG